MSHNYLPDDLADTHPSYQEETGYIFGFIPIHVNNPLLDPFDFFEYPKWYSDYLTFNKFRNQYPDVVKAAVKFDSEHDIKPVGKQAFYGPHLTEPLDPELSVRRGFELYSEDINNQRKELELYGKIVSRQTTSRQTRLVDGRLTKLPRSTGPQTFLDLQDDANLDDLDEGVTIIDEKDRKNTVRMTQEEGENCKRKLAISEKNPAFERELTNFAAPTVVPSQCQIKAAKGPLPISILPELSFNKSPNYSTNDSEDERGRFNPTRQLIPLYQSHYTSNDDNSSDSDDYCHESGTTMKQRMLRIYNRPLFGPLRHPHIRSKQSPLSHNKKIIHRVHQHAPIDSYTYEHSAVKPPYVQHAFYETIGPLPRRMLIEFLVPFGMVFNAHLSWMSPVGPWGAMIACLLIYSALHVSTAHVNTGITFILIGMIGWVSEWKYYIFSHAMGQLAAISAAYAISPGWSPHAVIDNVNYVRANLGPPGIITAGPMFFNPLLTFFMEGLVLTCIAINFTGKFHMQDAMVSPQYFFTTFSLSALIDFLFRPFFAIAFDGWFGLFNSTYTYLKDQTDLSTYLMQLFIYTLGPWTGAFIGGSLCRLSLHLEQRRWERYGFYTVWKYLSTMAPAVRKIWHKQLQSKQYVKLRTELDARYTSPTSKDTDKATSPSLSPKRVEINETDSSSEHTDLKRDFSRSANQVVDSTENGPEGISVLLPSSTISSISEVAINVDTGLNDSP
jgi:hypothetical protein